MNESRTALQTASEMRGLDTSKVVIDDDQAPPKIEAGSADEQTALAAMEDLLADGSPSKAASADLKLMCLRGRKYDGARAAALLPDLIELIEELDLATPTPRLAADLASGKFVMTGATDGAGRKILWLRFRFHDPKVSSPKDFARAAATVMLHALRDADTARCGVAVLQDMTGLRMKNISPPTAKLMFGQVFPRLPVRLGKLCVYNPPWFVGRILLPIVRMLLSAKLRARLVVLNGADREPLYRQFEPASLTEELGGSYPFDLACWAASVEPALS